MGVGRSGGAEGAGWRSGGDGGGAQLAPASASRSNSTGCGTRAIARASFRSSSFCLPLSFLFLAYPDL